MSMMPDQRYTCMYIQLLYPNAVTHGVPLCVCLNVKPVDDDLSLTLIINCVYTLLSTVPVLLQPRPSNTGRGINDWLLPDVIWFLILHRPYTLNFINYLILLNQIPLTHVTYNKHMIVLLRDSINIKKYIYFQCNKIKQTCMSYERWNTNCGLSAIVSASMLNLTASLRHSCQSPCSIELPQHAHTQCPQCNIYIL